jgi:hypothetical protein
MGRKNRGCCTRLHLRISSPLVVIPHNDLLSFNHGITRFFHRIPKGGATIRPSGLQDYLPSVKDMPAGEIKLKKSLLCIAICGLYKEYITSILHILYIKIAPGIRNKPYFMRFYAAGSDAGNFC